MSKLTFNLPGPAGSTEQLAAPSGIPVSLQGDAATSSNSIITTGTTLLFSIAAFLAVVMMILSGIQWITSSGDAEKIAIAKKRMMYAVIGLVIVILAYFIVSTVVTVLGGTPASYLTPEEILK